MPLIHGDTSATNVCSEETIFTVELHEQSIQEMLRKARQQQQHNRKAKQTTQLARNSHFSKKNWLPRVGLEPTTISLLVLPTELPRQLSWLGRILYTNLKASQPATTMTKLGRTLATILKFVCIESQTVLK